MSAASNQLILSLAIIAFITSCIFAAEEGVKKLQIGVKKRPEECPIKTKPGDKVHMHYTVSDQLYVVESAVLITSISLLILLMTGNVRGWDRIRQQSQEKRTVHVHSRTWPGH